MRIKKVAGNREEPTVKCLRQLCFGEEKMRFSRGEVVFHRLKIRSETANVAEVNEEKLREVSRHFGSSTREQSNLGTFLVPSPEGDSEGLRATHTIPYLLRLHIFIHNHLTARHNNNEFIDKLC
ncbi:hypothetical protein E2C01_076240 [Portunus trituberculatus]|uniref:Uncharacterized protein n=1 Tax=Portunus trituberculatus TaxID=210409 RepID=A0A5B7IN45_PORTR|nr:hypothetical protein [Portunus trituberculatus]